MTTDAHGVVPSLEAVPATVRHRHRRLSPLDWALRESGFAAGATAEDRSFRRLAGSVLAADDDFAYHPWPLLLDQQRWREIEADAVAVTRLLLDVPARLRGEGNETLARVLDLYPAAIQDILLAEPSGVSSAICRGDFFLGADGLQLLELNVSPNSGGWESGEMGRRYLGRADVAAALEASGGDAMVLDPVRSLFEHLVAETRLHVRPSPTRLDTALLIAPGQGAAFGAALVERLHALYRDVLAAEGLSGELLSAEPGTLRVERGEARVGERRVHAVVEDAVRSSPAVYRAFKGRRLALFNGPLEPILSDKRLPALLSEAAETDLYSEAERRLVRRLVPWTRPLTARLRDQVLRDRHLLVVKPAREAGGRGVTLGHRTDPGTWRQRVEEGVDAGDYVVQRRVAPEPYLSRAGSGDDPSGASSDEMALWHMVWGIYVLGDRAGGVLLRMLQAAAEGVISGAGDAVGSTVLVVPPTASGTMHRHDEP